MSLYKYVAIDPAGGRVSGRLDARSLPEAAGYLRGQGLIPLRLSPAVRHFAFLSIEIGGSRANLKALVMVCLQFSILLEAGMPLARAVELAAEHSSDRTLRRLLREVAKDVEAGRSMSDSFSARGTGNLPEAFVEMLRAGEATGNLGAVFAAMRDHFAWQRKSAARVRAAMFYPLFVLLIAALVVAVMMGVVVPRFAVMLGGVEELLPLPTRMLMDAAGFFQENWQALCLIPVLLVLAARLAGRTETGKILLARLALQLPVLGGIRRLHAGGLFANTLAATLSAGLPMTRAAAISARVLGNAYLREQAELLAYGLATGRGLAETMRECHAFPEILVDMCCMGEQSGELEHTLRAAASYYDAELNEAVARALARLEPALLVLVAGIAGFIVLAIYMAVFTLYGTL